MHTRAWRIGAFILTAALLLACAAAMQTPAQMVRGLDTLARITPEEAESLPPPQGTVEIRMAGKRLPYDEQSNTYFLPQDDSAAFVGSVTLVRERGREYSLCAYEGVDKAAAVAGSIGYRVYGCAQDACSMSKIIFTSLPILCITTDGGSLPAQEDEKAQLLLFTAQNGSVFVEELPISIHIRGNTSQRFPKKSYRVTIEDERGCKVHRSLAGLRSDDDWILNPLYTDTSKVREWLAYETWAAMNSVGTRAESSRLRHVELFINGEYFGLYGLQERIDRKQVAGDKATGVLYKVLANERPSAQELLACTDAEICGGIKLEFAGSAVSQPWAAAAGYMAYLDGEETAQNARLHTGNCIDYGLFAMLTQAHDCHYKNQFLHGVFEDGLHTLYKIPWDLNNTFGDVWKNDAEETNFTEHYIGKRVCDCVLELLLASEDAQLLSQIATRWQALREDVLSQERLLAPAQELHTRLLPAIRRDTSRWPECGMGMGNTDDLDDIIAYLDTVLPELDAYFASLGA